MSWLLVVYISCAGVGELVEREQHLRSQFVDEVRMMPVSDCSGQHWEGHRADTGKFCSFDSSPVKKLISTCSFTWRMVIKLVLCTRNHCHL